LFAPRSQIRMEVDQCEGYRLGETTYERFRCLASVPSFPLNSPRDKTH
jgi:hypothetical protein